MTSAKGQPVSGIPSKKRRARVVDAIPTTAEISRIAGVSKSTVSRALKKDPSISAETSRRILSIAMSLGYMPNAIARGLSTSRSGIIGFVTSEAEHYYYQEHLQHLGRLASQRGKQLMLFQIAADGDMSDVVPALVQYRLDGCILIAIAPVSNASIETCSRYKIPIVVLNRVLPETAAFSVLCDHFNATREAAQLFVEAGHQHIAFVAGRSNNPVGQIREEGFMSGLAAVKRKIHTRMEEAFSFEGGYEAGRKLLSMKTPPDAVFVANDLMAFGLIEAAREAGAKIPKDISVIGFDNSKMAAWSAFKLTTYAQPIDQMFNRALDLILSYNPASNHVPETIYIRAQLVIRESARLPERVASKVGS
jgi:DNA-binding LacI/PurR family transcriptional regulator